MSATTVQGRQKHNTLQYSWDEIEKGIHKDTRSWIIYYRLGRDPGREKLSSQTTSIDGRRRGMFRCVQIASRHSCTVKGGGECLQVTPLCSLIQAEDTLQRKYNETGLGMEHREEREVVVSTCEQSYPLLKVCRVSEERRKQRHK